MKKSHDQLKIHMTDKLFHNLIKLAITKIFITLIYAFRG